jgi:hypothetical protein
MMPFREQNDKSGTLFLNRGFCGNFRTIFVTRVIYVDKRKKLASVLNNNMKIWNYSNRIKKQCLCVEFFVSKEL